MKKQRKVSISKSNREYKKVPITHSYEQLEEPSKKMNTSHNLGMQQQSTSQMQNNSNNQYSAEFYY